MLSNHINKAVLSVFCFSILILTSCKKLDEIGPPINTIGPEAVFRTDEKALSALAGMYSLMINQPDLPSMTCGIQSVMGAILSDEGKYMGGNPNDDFFKFYTAQYNIDNLISSMMWDAPFKIIYAANGIEEGVNSSTSAYLTQPTRRQILGEVKLVRAFIHFNLVNTFGEIPLITTTNVNINKSIQKSSVAKVYERIETDLKDAFDLLTDDFIHNNGKKFRPNKYSAAALLARLYLYQERWNEAAAMADTVIRSNKFSLATIENAFAANNSEALWQLNQTESGEKMLVDASYFTPIAAYSSDPIENEFMFREPEFYELLVAEGFIHSRIIASDELVNSFAQNDQRLRKWLDSIPSPYVAPYNGKTEYFSVKYNRAISTLTGTIPANLTYTVIRLAELYLIRAEALAKGNINLIEAVNDVNIIRNRAGLDGIPVGNQQEVIDAIEEERKLELCFEWGHRWYDLKRTGKATSTLGSLPHKQPWSELRLLLPIPESEIVANPRLTQNKDYR